MTDMANMAAGAAKPIETTVERFRSDVLEPSLQKVVLVDFWAPWCGPCKQLAPVIERLVAATGGKAILVKMNIDAEPEVASQLGIKSIPAVVAFQRGRPVDGFVGALPESQIKGFLERLVGPVEDAADAMEAVQAMIDEGDVAGAHALLSELTSQEPVNPKAFAMLARLYLAAEQLDSARAVLDRLPESARKDADVAAATAAIENAAAAQDLGEIEDLGARINFDPNDLQAYFDLALALNAKDRRQEAADALLEIVRRDRSWNDDGARKQLVQFFEAWGPMDKAAVAARRRLSTLLFS
ncbi:MAG TPA: thioredoxin [Methylocystis sp.]|jgi:putative thioredoxin